MSSTESLIHTIAVQVSGSEKKNYTLVAASVAADAERVRLEERLAIKDELDRRGRAVHAAMAEELAAMAGLIECIEEEVLEKDRDIESLQGKVLHSRLSVLLPFICTL